MEYDRIILAYLAQDKLEHVAVHLLHDDEDLVFRLEHALELYDPLVVDLLQDHHFALEGLYARRGLLREAVLRNDLNVWLAAAPMKDRSVFRGT